MTSNINNITLKDKTSKQFSLCFETISTLAVSAFMVIAIVLLVANPTRYMKSILAGVNLFYHSVMPSLLPFFFISKIIFGLGIFTPLIKLFEKPMQKIFKLPSITSYVFFMSILCGYPVGAKLIGDLFSENLIDEEDSKKMICICSTSGPIFVIGSVGAGLFGNTKLGASIFICHILSCIVTGLILSLKFKNKTSNPYSPSRQLNVLQSAVNSTTSSILVVAIYVSIFYMFIDMLYDLNLLKCVASLFESIFKLLKINSNISQSIASGIIEITRGLFELKHIENQTLKLIIASGIISFGGLSIFIQSMTFLAKTKIKASHFFKVKCLQCVTSIIIAWIYAKIFF